MKFIRFILAWLFVAVMAAALLVGASFSPVVQRWWLNHVLAQGAFLRGGVDAVFAGPRSAEIEKLHLAGPKFALKVPHAEARASVWGSLLRRTIVIKTLTAKGWTLDFARPAPTTDPAADAGATEAVPAVAPTRDAVVRAKVLEVADMLRGWVGSARLPMAVTLGAVDLEGDILWPYAADEPPIVIHVTIKGGDLNAAHPGDFVLTADTADLRLAAISIKLDSHFHVAMATPRALGRLQWTAVITTGDQRDPSPWSVDALVARSSAGADLRFAGRRGERQVAEVTAHFDDARQQWTGSWATDFLAADLTAWLSDGVQPLAGLKGRGDFAADAALTKINLGGRLEGRTIPRVAWTSAWAGPGEAVNVDAAFQAVQQRGNLRINTAQVVVSGQAGAAVKLTTMQPFSLNETNGAVSVEDPKTDALRVSLQAVPLAWADSWVDRYAFAGGELNGELVVRKSVDGWTMPEPAALRAGHVSVSRDDRVVFRNLDFVAQVRVNRQAGLWHLRADPIELWRGDGRLAVLRADLAQTSGAARLLRLTGSGRADLTDRVWQDVWPRPGLMPARMATGDFAGTLGAETQLAGTLAVTGANPNHAVKATYTLTSHADGSGEVVAPVRIALGGSATELSADLKWGGDGGSPSGLDITGGKIDFEPLRRLAARAGLLPGATREGEVKNAVSPVADRVPFWSMGPSRIDVQFAQVTVQGHEFVAVGGTIRCDPALLKLEGGHAQLGLHTIEPIAGAITFDATATEPYRLTASAAVTHIGAGWFFGFPRDEGKPQVEGHFDVQGSMTGTGMNVGDLGSQLHMAFHLHSINGITRLLQTDVAQVLPSADKPRKVSDSLVNVGSAVGKLFGAKAAFDSGRIKLSPAREAVLNLDAILGVVGYDDFTIDGTRAPDGRIILTSIALTAPEERLTGHGEIAPLAGRPLLERPFSADLQLAVKGGITPFFTKAKLLAAQRDAAGYTPLVKTCRWGGTLAAIDPAGWRQLLIDAATRDDPAPPKTP